MQTRPGFIAALDQSGGSTPKALAQYGIAQESYHSDAEMFALVHAMRVRIMQSSAFRGDKVIGAILFERTMDGEVEGTPVPAFLWKQRGVVPFLKIDQGLEAEANGVQLMKPMPGADALLARAARLGVFGTKERSFITLASPEGVRAVVKQQFEVAEQVARHGLVPIIEPEVSIKCPQKAEAEALLRDELVRGLDALAPDVRVMIKITLPEEPNFYLPLVGHPRVVRVVALSGGYSLAEANRRLAQNRGIIASFSRALIDDLRVSQSEEEFDRTLGNVIDSIFTASTSKS
jgi:fructose-bisphosphate aldolase class I